MSSIILIATLVHKISNKLNSTKIKNGYFIIAIKGR